MRTGTGAVLAAITVVVGLVAAAAKPTAETQAAPSPIESPSSIESSNRPVVAAQEAVSADDRLALVSVPDPRVPRYRRDFDEMIAAIELGMAAKGYALDHFAFPWAKSKDGNASPTPSATNKNRSPDSGDSVFGSMVFRCDGWRNPGFGCDADEKTSSHYGKKRYDTHLTTLYLIPETATYGLSRAALGCAIAQIHSRISEAGSAPQGACEPLPAAPISHDGALEGPAELASLPDTLCSPGSIVLLGPVFSGSVASIREAALALPADGHLCALSSTATSETNPRAVTGDAMVGRLQFTSLAVSSARKLEALKMLALKNGVELTSVALLTEASTFGNDVCEPGSTPESLVKLCTSAIRIGFPSNIADVRSNFVQETPATAKSGLPVLQAPHLTLAEGLNNGSEFPQVLGAAITAASAELQLNHLIADLHIRRPRIVVVVATDVRDRLFLFEKLRESLPEVLLVDFEGDQLLAHADYIHASRGALSLASAEISCEVQLVYPQLGAVVADGSKARQLESWTFDGQSLLAQSVAGLNQGVFPPSCVTAGRTRAPDALRLHVVTRSGLKSVASWSSLRDLPIAGQFAAKPASYRLMANSTCAIVLLLSLFSVEGIKAGLAAGRGLLASGALDTAIVSLRYAVATALVWPIVCQFLEPPETYVLTGGAVVVGCVLSFLIRMVWAYLVWLVYGSMSPRWGHFQAVCLAGTVLYLNGAAWWSDSLKQSQGFEALIDHDNLLRLGLDWNSGIAYHSMLQVATLALLAAAYSILGASMAGARNYALIEESYKKALPTLVESLKHFSRRLSIDSTLILLLGLSPMLAPLRRIRLSPQNLRLTIFGQDASLLAVVAIAATSIAALMLCARAVKLGRRLLVFCGHVTVPLPIGPATAGTTDQAPEPWRDCFPERFAVTPILARLPGAYLRRELMRDRERWSQALQSALNPRILHPDASIALYLLLSSEVRQFRRLSATAAACSLAAVAEAYLFPVSEVDFFLIYSLCLAIAISAISGLYAISFERNEVLSRVLCNRDKKVEISSGLVLYIAGPVLALAASLAFTEVPGVSSWSGGIVATLLAQFPGL